MSIGDTTMAKNDKTGDVLVADVVAAANTVAASASALSTSAAAASSPAVAKTIAAVAGVAQTVAVETPVEHVSFDQFWMMMSKKLKLAGHLREIIVADFKGRGMPMSGPLHKF